MAQESAANNKRGRKTKAVIHRPQKIRTGDLAYTRHQATCELCRRDHADVVNVELLEARQARTSEARRAAIQQVIQKHGLNLTLAEELDHHANHRAPQATPSSPRIVAQLEGVRFLMSRSPGRRERLEYIARAGKVTASQFGEMFWRNDLNPRRQAARELRLLATHHLTYCVRHANNPAGWFQQVWGPGFAGAEYLSRATDRPWDWINGPKQIGFKTLVHDIGVVDDFNAVYLHSGKHQTGFGEVELTTKIENFYTAGPDLDRLNISGLTGSGKHKYISPDAFTAIGIDLTTPPPGIAPSSLNPLLLENDTGTHDVRNVAHQIVSHILLGNSRSLLQRLPDLNQAPKGYAVPVCFIFAHTDGDELIEAATRRITYIFRKARELVKEAGITQISPVFGVHKLDWLADPLFAPTYNLWDTTADGKLDEQQFQPDGKRLPVIYRLIEANKSLAESTGLNSQSVLAFDPQAGSYTDPDAQREALQKARLQVAEDRMLEAARQGMRNQQASAVGSVPVATGPVSAPTSLPNGGEDR